MILSVKFVSIDRENKYQDKIMLVNLKILVVQGITFS